MHHRIDTILTALRQDIGRHLDADSIRSACRSIGHTWRKCRLDPVAIVHWFVIQILHCNTALAHVALLGDHRFTDSAYCQARARLPLAVLQAVLRNLVESLTPDTQTEGTWRGHRTLLIDGSGLSMSDTPALQTAFGQPGGQTPGCGFPVTKILALFHAGTGVLLKVIAMPLRSHDMASVGAIPAELRPNDVLVGDRGLCSFAHLAMLVQGGFHAVFRIHQKQIVDFTPNRPHARPGEKGKSEGRPRSRWLRGLGVLDQVVEWSKPRDRPDWMTAEDYAKLPSTLVVRELRYEVGRPGFRTRAITLVTTLLDADLYPLDALAELYRTRWQVELNLRHLKITMKMDVLKCKTVEGVHKELTVYAIVYNLVCVVMTEAARRQGVAVNRISFVGALRWLAQAKPGDELPKLVVNPDRFGRVEPRVRKRRPKQYPVMKKPRSVLRKDLLGKGITD
jgi:hypothetical protein